MVSLSVCDGKLVCEVEGAHKIWACRSRLEVPLEHIKGVTLRSPETQNWWHGWKMMGTDLPGVFAAGLFRVNGRWVFWDVRHPENAIEIDLQDETFDRLLVEVEDPEAAERLITEALSN